MLSRPRGSRFSRVCTRLTSAASSLQIVSATKFLISQVYSEGRFRHGWAKSFSGLGGPILSESLPSMWIGPRSHCLLVLACIALGLLSPGRQFAQNQDPGPAQTHRPSSMLSFRMISDTRIECRHANSGRKATPLGSVD